jgi:hypothetical protein
VLDPESDCPSLEEVEEREIGRESLLRDGIRGYVESASFLTSSSHHLQPMLPFLSNDLRWLGLLSQL